MFALSADPSQNAETTEEEGGIEDEFLEEEGAEPTDVQGNTEKIDEKKPNRKGMVGRGGISLGMLVDDGILKPGSGCLTMEYQVCVLSKSANLNYLMQKLSVKLFLLCFRCPSKIKCWNFRSS